MKVIGHRGAAGCAPENTLAAVRYAIKKGADGVEIDVRLTADGELVVCHDPDTARCGDRALVVGESRLAELRAIDVGGWFSPQYAGERMPLLSEVLHTVPKDKEILVELKGDGHLGVAQAQLQAYAGRLGEAIGRLVAKQPDSGYGRCWWMSFDTELLEGIRSRWPEWRRMRLLGPDYRGGDRSEALRMIDGYAGLGVSHEAQLNAAFREVVQEAGGCMSAWTVNEVEEARRLAAEGWDYVTSDCPCRLTRMNHL